MTTVQSWSAGGALGAWVLNVLVQIAAVVLMAMVITRTSTRRYPAARYGVWLCALACVCVGPLAAWGFQRAGVALVRLPWLPPADFVQPMSGPAACRPDLLTIVIGTWLLGVAFLLARLAWGWRLLAALRRELSPVDPDRLGDVPARVCRTLGIAQLPAIMTCRRVASPISLGIRRPVIVLPSHTLEAFGGRGLHDVLVHECAHFLRHDHLLGLVQRLVQVVFWPHPLIYLLNRELARAREEVCDNYVLRTGDGPGYARTLLALSQRTAPARPTPSSIGILQPRYALEQRVAGLFDKRRKLVTRVGRLGAMLGTLGFLLFTAALAGTWLVAAAPPEPPAAAPQPAAAFATRDPQPTAIERPARAGIPRSPGPESAVAASLAYGAQPGGRPHRAPASQARDTLRRALDEQFLATSARRLAELANAAVKAPARPARDPGNDVGPRTADAEAQPREAKPEAVVELQPMVQVSYDGRNYLVWLRLAEGMDTQWTLRSGETRQLSVLEGEYESVLLEVTVEPDEADDEVTLSYRLAVETPEGRCLWQALEQPQKLGQWRPLTLDTAPTEE